MSELNKPAMPQNTVYLAQDGQTRSQGPQGGMTARQYAAIHLRVPMSGDAELDAMIREARRLDMATAALPEILAQKDVHDGRELDNTAWIAFKQADAMLAASEPKKAEPEDPLDTPLPCDIQIGTGTIKKGCKLRTLVARMEVLNGIAADSLRPKSKDPAFESLRSLANNIAASQVNLESVGSEPCEHRNRISDGTRIDCTDCGETLQPDAEGWIEWKGGECPVEESVRVAVRMQDGREIFTCTAGEWEWDHYRNNGDIVAYRVVKEAES